MEMDCYPEYKQHIHPNHQLYNNNVAANHPYYPGNYGPSTMRYPHTHPLGESGQQPNWADGYSRYNHGQHHLSHHGNYPSSFSSHYGVMRENFHANTESSGQFYYHNAQQSPSGYYGSQSFESYRGASSSYHYHYPAGSSGYHQSASHATLTPYYPSSYSAEQFNNRYYPTPPPSAPPTQRDPFAHPHPNDQPANYATSVEREPCEKLNNERISIESHKSSLNDPIASSSPSSPAVKQSTENAENSEREKKLVESQQMELRESSSSHNSAQSNESEKPKIENADEAFKVSDGSGSKEQEPKASEQRQPSSNFNENSDRSQNTSFNESITKANSVGSRESASISEAENSIATEYHYQPARDLQSNRHRKSPRENDKSLKDANIIRSKSSDSKSNANDPFNRCSTTPFVSMPSSPFNHNNMPPHSYPPHQRLPPNFPHAAAAHNYWYSQQQHPPSHLNHHNWMMNPYMRNRRGSYTDAQTLPSSIQYNRSAHNEKHKMYEETSPPPKRTKRKPKPSPTPKNEPKNEIMKNVTPLPGFLQTFGGTEIGRFSEAFFTTSDSPNPYYNNSIESDVESPQPWDFDSLDGPVNMQVGAAFQVYGSETEYDSPINNFSELICNEY